MRFIKLGFTKIFMTGAAALSTGLLLSTSAAGSSADISAEATNEIAKENFVVNAQSSSTAYSDLTKTASESEYSNTAFDVGADSPGNESEGLPEIPLIDTELHDGPGTAMPKPGPEDSLGSDTAVGQNQTNASGSAKTDKEADTAMAGNDGTVPADSSQGANTSETADGMTTGNSGNPPAVSGPERTDYGNAPSAGGSTDVNSGNTGGSNSPAGTTQPENPPAAPTVSPKENEGAASDSTGGGNYGHTTSIYTNDESTLLRVEYYDENNKLVEYSSVTDYDTDTKSYTETVYRYDDENQVQVVVRTDTYVNGELVSSESN